MSFKKQIAGEIKTLLELAQDNSHRTFSFEQIADLPAPVKRYFQFVLTEGHSYISYTSLRFEGLLRLKKTQQWSPIKGEEYHTASPPGYIWVGTLKASPFFWLTFRDYYLHDKGNALAKAYSLFTVGTAKGTEIDQGALSRWLSEAVLYPTALLPNENLAWEHIDENSARLLFSYKGISIVALVYFGRNGEILRMTTDRCCLETGSFEKWSVYCKSYQDYRGTKIPTEGGAIWHFATENFHYARFRFSPM